MGDDAGLVRREKRLAGCADRQILDVLRAEIVQKLARIAAGDFDLGEGAQVEEGGGIEGGAIITHASDLVSRSLSAAGVAVHCLVSTTSPEPTLPAALRTRKTRTCVPGRSSSVLKRNDSAFESNRPSVGNTFVQRLPSTANDASVRRT